MKMKLATNNKTDFKELSVWIISVYIIGIILIILTTKYLDDFVNDWLFKNIKVFLGLLILGIIIMSLINSIQIIRKKEIKQNIKWFILSVIPFIMFLIGLILSVNWMNLLILIFGGYNP